MKGIWHGESDEMSLIEGKEYEILGSQLNGEWFRVIDETGEDYMYPAEDFEITEK